MKKKTVTFICAALTFCLLILCFTACTTFENIKEDILDMVNDIVAIDDVGNELENGKTYDMPNALKFFAASPNSSKTIRLAATITPSSATDKSVDWEIAWVDASSAWATGKTVTDYVTVTPTSDGALTADVHFVANFGEKIRVSVTPRSNRFVTASCIVGCYRSLGDMRFDAHDDYDNKDYPMVNTIDLPSLNFFGNTNDSSVHNSSILVFNPRYSSDSAWSSDPYTDEIAFLNSSLYVKLSPELASALNSALNISSYNSDWKEVTRNAVNRSGYEDEGAFITLIDFYQVLFNGFLTHGVNSGVYDNYTTVVNVLRQVPSFSIKVIATFSSVGEITKEYNVSFSSSSLGLVASSVSLNEGSIIF